MPCHRQPSTGDTSMAMALDNDLEGITRFGSLSRAAGGCQSQVAPSRASNVTNTGPHLTAFQRSLLVAVSSMGMPCGLAKALRPWECSGLPLSTALLRSASAMIAGSVTWIICTCSASQTVQGGMLEAGAD